MIVVICKDCDGKRTVIVDAFVSADEKKFIKDMAKQKGHKLVNKRKGTLQDIHTCKCNYPPKI